MELVGYEDVEARSHEVLASLVVHQIDVHPKYISLSDYWKEPDKYFLQIGEKYNWEAFHKFHSQNKEGIINIDEFRSKVQELQNKGYATFVFNNKNSCFRQFT